MRLAILASIGGPISSPSWKARVRCDPDSCRFTRQPIRSSAANTPYRRNKRNLVPSRRSCQQAASASAALRPDEPGTLRRPRRCRLIRCRPGRLRGLDLAFLAGPAAPAAQPTGSGEPACARLRWGTDRERLRRRSRGYPAQRVDQRRPGTHDRDLARMEHQILTRPQPFACPSVRASAARCGSPPRGARIPGRSATT